MNFNIPTSYKRDREEATSAPACPGCEQPCIAKASGPQSKNPGKEFWACGSTPYCRNTGWIGWVEGGATRAPAAKRQVPDHGLADRLTALEKGLADLAAYVASLNEQLHSE